MTSTTERIDTGPSMSGRRLNLHAPALRLMSRGNALHWTPDDLDFSQDAVHWAELPERYRKPIDYFVTMFAAGEETVAAEIVPFLTAMARDGRVEDALYLSQFAFEEARHTVAFHRWLDAVGMQPDVTAMHSNDGYMHVFGERLPAAMNALEGSRDPLTRLTASLVYNQVAEGMMAVTGYFGISTLCEGLGVLPGLQELIGRISGDERRHIAWGTHTCRRLLAEHPDLRPYATETLDGLEPSAVASFEWVFAQLRRSPLKFARRAVVTRVRDNAHRRRAAIGLPPATNPVGGEPASSPEGTPA